MNATPDHKDKRTIFGLPKSLWLVLALFIVFVVSVQMQPATKPFVNPKIVSDAYVWPLGCDKKIYVAMDKINKDCLAQKYYIGDGQNWGWKRTSKWPHYYRVGNDAVLVTDIIAGTALSDRITVLNIVKDVFVVSARRDEREDL